MAGQSTISRAARAVALLAVALGATGCATATIEPGHRGLLFAPAEGGLQREVLVPGRYNLGWCFLACTSKRVADYDVTYTMRRERVQGMTAEGLPADVEMTVITRPILAELYELASEIGPRWYDEVVSAEARSAARAVLVRHERAELPREHVRIEDEMEAELRHRVAGRHVEISSITIERVRLPAT